MTGFKISANYNKHENSHTVKPVITNSVTVNNVVGETPSAPPTERRLIDGKDYTLPSPKSTSSSTSSLTPLNPIDETCRCAFERRYLGICRAVLCNKKLCEEVIDENGDMILSVSDLTDLIKLVTGENEVEIVIQEPMFEVCCIKIKTSPFATFINRIVVNGMDFSIGFNRISTMLSNEYKISLTKVAF